jgi:tetratricopeptide (TPR) repeat protein
LTPGASRGAWGTRRRARLEEALRLDSRYADTHYLLGLLDLSSGDEASARRHLVGALHWDALRFRPDPEINAIIRRVAGRHGADAVLVDSAMALGSDPASTAAPSGRELLFEHVHFDWEGNYRMALLMAGACASALGDRGGAAAPFLGDDACAEALGYTGHERLPMLMGINVLVRKPPFTNQLTYVWDQARLARMIEAAGSVSRDRAVTEAAEGVVRRALAADPENPALAGILEGICNETGKRDEALELARRVERLLPSDYALGADEASILVGLGRYAEAEAILRRASETGADLDLLAPVYGELWARSGRFADGLGFLGGAIARRPDDRRLRVARAELLRGTGDLAGAERELRRLLALHPSDEDALEALVRVLAGEGHPEAATQACLAAAGSQPMNQANNLRSAKACEDAGDGAREVGYLEAAERSGPVNTTFELTLALKLYKQARRGEMMERLAEALALSRSEGSPALTESIRGLIGRMSGQARAGERAPP